MTEISDQNSVNSDQKKEQLTDMLKVTMMPMLGDQPFVFIWIDERQYYVSKVLGSARLGDRVVRGDYETVMGGTVVMWERKNSQGWRRVQRPGYPGFVGEEEE